jgi:hypothetical protein
MKNSVLVLAVLAVGLPSFALAGEPVPMNDNDLDAVVAGQTINLREVNALIRANQEQFRQLAARNSAIFFANEATVRRLLDDDLEKLLPAHN